MKQILSFLLLLSCLSIFGQGKDIKKALSDGRKPGRFYVCNPSVSELCTLSELLHYAKANNLLVNSVLEDELNRYGKPYTAAVYVEFMPKSEMAAFLKESGHAEDFTNIITTEEELRFAGKVDQIRRNNKQKAWHQCDVDMSSSSISKVLEAKHYVFSYDWHGYNNFTVYFGHLSDMGATILQEFCSGMSVQQFKNKVTIPVFSGEDVVVSTMRWDGAVDANGRPNGTGHALKLESSKEALFVSANFVNGLPEGKISYSRINLSRMMLRLAKVPTYYHLTTWEANTTSGDGMCRIGSSFYNSEYQRAFVLNPGEKAAQRFSNGLLHVTKDYGGKEIAYNRNKKGELVNYTDASIKIMNKEIRDYIDIVGGASMPLVKAENFAAGLCQKVSDACKRQGYSPNQDLITYLLDSEFAALQVEQKDAKYLRALTLMQKAFSHIDDSSADLQYRRQMDYANYGSIFREKTFLEFLFMTSRPIQEYSDNALFFYGVSLSETKKYYDQIDRLCTLPVSNWSSFKPKSLKYIEEQKSLYSAKNSEPRRVWNARVNKYREQVRQNEIDYTKKQLKLCRVDGDKSTLPSGWVPEDTSWLFGHPGYSENDGTIYLENGDHVEWRYYGEKVQIMGGSYGRSGDEFKTVEDMIKWLVKTATERWQRELDRI